MIRMNGVDKVFHKSQIERIYNNYADELRSFLKRKETDPALVDDIVQDAFLKLFIHQQKGNQIRTPQSWLFKVGQNLINEHYRKKKKKLTTGTLVINQTNYSNSHGPEDCLLGIIANLPYKYKKAVYLTDIKGVRQVDAAKQLKLALPTFKSQVQRGRKLVAEGYIDCCDYELNEAGKLIGESKDWDQCRVCRQDLV